MLPNGWHACSSTAVQAYRFAPASGVLQVVFVEGRVVYDYPCTAAMFERFLRADSKGRFVNDVLKPYAEQRGASVRAHRWTGW